jgi:NAD(P)-dependent dehydrogenase (short-subunit alcohol dehydrogenase family)
MVFNIFPAYYIMVKNNENKRSRQPQKHLPKVMFQHVVAIISGGASGLGAATASHLVRNGARVVVADCGPAAQEQFLKMEASLSDDGVEGRLKFSMTDVTREEDVSFALNVVEEEFGEQGT